MTRVVRWLLYTGVAAAVGIATILHARVVADVVYDPIGTSRFAWAIAYAVVLAIAAYGVGLPDLARSARAAIVPGILSAVAAALAVSVVQLVVGDALLPRFVVALAAILVVPWYVFCSWLASRGRSRAEGRDLVVVVGSSADAEDLQEELSRSPEKPASVVAAYSPRWAGAVAGSSRPLEGAVSAVGATVLVLGREAQASEVIISQAAAVHQNGVRVRTLSLFNDQWLGRIPVSELERVAMMFDIGEIHRARYSRMKRLGDLVVALSAFPLLVLAAPCVFAGNVAGNRGPLFYRQTRVGKGGATFEILKFRTMEPGRPHDGTAWTTADDPRITRFGRLLRRTHIDEMPQLLNVLRGELSLVGPRPEQLHYVNELRQKLPFYDVRHLVRPGMTGWAQVKYGYAGDEQHSLEKLQYDMWYLRHQGLTLDLRIIGRTVRSVVGGQGQ